MLIEKTFLPGHPAHGSELRGTSPAIDQLRQLIRKVARTQATILIRGEYGTGKQSVAAALHSQSPRAQAPLFRAHCAGLSPATLETQLFGCEITGESGTPTQQQGLLELAHGGTILLEEIGEIPPAVQARLLRLLQEGTFERVGGKHSLKADVRILATSNRDLETRVRRGEFREDLFIRLNIVPVLVPPLRTRKGDVPVLADHFRLACARSLGIEAPPISTAGFSALESHPWPGNVRELQQRIELAMVAAPPGHVIEPAHLGFAGRAASYTAIAGKDFVDPLTEMEKRHIFAVLDRCQWNRGNAALRLGISIRTLRNKLKEYGDASPDGQPRETPERQP